MCAQDLEGPAPRAEDAVPLLGVLGTIFQDEVSRLKEIFTDACSSMRGGIDRSKTYYENAISTILENIESTLKAKEPGESTPLYENRFEEKLENPVVQAISKLMLSLIQAAGVFSRRSFEAAFLVASKLQSAVGGERDHSTVSVSVDEGDRVRIHPVWSKLADRGHRLVPSISSFNYEVETIARALEEASRALSKKVGKVHDWMHDHHFSKLARFIHKVLKEREKEVGDLGDVRALIVSYVVNHLSALGEHLRDINEFKNDHILQYLGTVFGKRCFLEYEVYVAFLDHGFPALPRLVVQGRDVYGELDVAAVVKGELWLVEVTTSENEKELENKARKLPELENLLNASKAVVVCTKKAREICENLGIPDSLHFITFEAMYSELQKVAETPKRRRLAAKPLTA